MIKYGKTKSGNQRYICKLCKKTRVKNYTYQAYKPDIDESIIQFTKEGLGIRSTARLLKISTTTLLKRIVSIARNITKPIIRKGKTYEVDELCTYIRHKKNYIWLVYALEKNSKTVVSFNVGKRTNKTLSRVLDTLKLSEAKKIFTDRLKNYRYLIDEKLHSVKRFGTNHIERKNLTLRTHLKRLNRRTICFSKSLIVLISVLKIYFWI
jgi:IS1 family transposase